MHTEIRKAVPIVVAGKARKRRIPVAHPRDTAARPAHEARAPADWRPVTTRPAGAAHDPGA